MNLDRNALAGELQYQMSRSSGKGGQNVNKVSTKVEVGFSIMDSNLFTDEEKQQLYSKLIHRITKEGLLKTSSEEERSQLLNKQRVIEKMARLLENALKIEKPRKATKPSKASIEKRLNDKLRKSLKKINRDRKNWY
ncbi:alternative ribosome rescue aminoacyl-tRNA hydrolase ArfB [Solitalea lacus]|uniref:alternative ribosome rescue aminoacyl-tRNA hydrolase ArfB n=1 Tax=Solitalea lacus TaxID=2911172 RepID=UPI001EDBD727|nr:alternative ribosome rescue aminoacyl-tRNA hydrolase ArfB [Solitalea lacus]UKJ08952.1 aminoacyl-tRNA hydrolase [Solitalea lacus]